MAWIEKRFIAFWLTENVAGNDNKRLLPETGRPCDLPGFDATVLPGREIPCSRPVNEVIVRYAMTITTRGRGRAPHQRGEHDSDGYTEQGILHLRHQAQEWLVGAGWRRGLSHQLHPEEQYPQAHAHHACVFDARCLGEDFREEAECIEPRCPVLRRGITLDAETGAVGSSRDVLT